MNTKVSREIREYLHLYMGCMYQWQDESGEWRRALPLTSYQLNDVIRHHIGARLILRRLADMTDDEVKELFHWEKVRHEYKDISFDRWTVKNHTTGGITLTGITMNYTIPTDEGDHVQSWTLEFSGMNAYDFKWCLSKGFDLFGLIDEGLAIDKTNLLSQ